MSTIGSSLQKAEDGTPMVARANLEQLAGVEKYLTRSEFDTAVADERIRIAASGTGIYQPGERFFIVGEEGYRSWILATGGSNAANAAASNAKTVVYQNGRSLLLAGDANTSTTTTGAPSSGVGSNGDARVDWAAYLIYVKTAGAWAVALKLADDTAAAGSLALRGAGGVLKIADGVANGDAASLGQLKAMIMKQHFVKFVPGTGVVTDGVVDATSLNGPWTWTAPSGCIGGLISGTGAGGGGAGGGTGAVMAAGAGGGGSGLCISDFQATWVPGAALVITAGAAGVGKTTSTPGGNGGSTSVSGLDPHCIGTLVMTQAATVGGTLTLAGGNGGYTPSTNGNGTQGGEGGKWQNGNAGTGMGGAGGGGGGGGGAAPNPGTPGLEVGSQVSTFGFIGFGAYLYAHGGSGGGGSSSTGSVAGREGGSYRGAVGRIVSAGLTAQTSAGGTTGTVSMGGGGSGGPSLWGSPGLGGIASTGTPVIASSGIGFGYGGGGGAGGGGFSSDGGPGFLQISYWSTT